jgi:hypothetical protein
LRPHWPGRVFADRNYLTRAGFAGGIWGTYQQWNAKGAQVRRGEHGTTIVFWKIDNRCDQREDDNEADEGDGRHRVFARAYTVFNASQVDGYTPPETPALADIERIDRAERFCTNLGIEVRHGGNSAFYTPTSDFVRMPEFHRFRDGISYYAVLLHECGHASGAKHRLNRDLSGRFGSEAYAMEECVVELLSALICGDLSLSAEPRADHASYMRHGLRCCATTRGRSSPHRARPSKPLIGCTPSRRPSMPSVGARHDARRAARNVSLDRRRSTAEKSAACSLFNPVRHGSRMDTSPKSAQPSYVPILASRPKPATITPPIFQVG